MKLFDKFTDDVQLHVSATKAKIYTDGTHVLIYFKDLEDEISHEVFDTLALEW